MKYKFITDNKNIYPIEKMAKVLNLSKSGYYKWLEKPISDREIEDNKILCEIKKIHKESKSTYGSPRVHNSLQTKGIKCGKNKVVRLMKENNVFSKIRKKYKATTDSNHNNPVSENTLDRKFAVDKPNKVWVSDITYIWTLEGWLYLCFIIDLFSRKVVGWSMKARMDSSLVTNAFYMAYMQRKPERNELLFHSDRGSQYASKEFQKVLKDKEVLSSMSRKGNCWDNACAESFVHTLKVEEVHHSIYRNREIAQVKIFEYIEGFYNNSRMHSTLGYMSPVEFEKKKIA